MPDVTDLRIEVINYWVPEGKCTGTNVMWMEDGKHKTSRLPWVETIAGAKDRIEKLRGTRP